MNPEQITSKANELLGIEKEADREKAIKELDPKFKEAVMDEMASLQADGDGDESGGDKNDDGSDQGDGGEDSGEDGSGDSGDESDGGDHDEKSELDLEVEKLGEMSEDERKEALEEYEDDNNKKDLIEAVDVYVKAKENEKPEEEKTKKQGIFERIGGFLKGGNKEEKAEVKAEYERLMNEAQNSEAGKNYEDALESLEIAAAIAQNKDSKKKAFEMMRAINKILNPEKEKPKAGRKAKEITDLDIIADVLTLIVKCEQKEKQNIANGQNGIRFNRLKKQLKRTLRWLK